jgi:Fe-S-cluster containining protein
MMHPACKLCRGACCESFLWPATGNAKFDEYALARGHAVPGCIAEWNHVCEKLKDGKCSIYEKRPQVCREYLPGSVACKLAIELHRGNDPKILELL